MKRTGLASKSGLPQTADSLSLPAPVGGLNTRDPVSVMPVNYAINLTNCIPTPEGISVREGYRVRNTGLPGYVESLASYYSVAGGSDKLFAWSNNAVYDVTVPSAVGAPDVAGFTNSKWTTVNFGTPGGQYLICANGVDNVQHYDGTTWVSWSTVVSPTAPGQISGVPVNTLNRPIMHQRRLWFVQENSTKAWYLPINSIGGAAAVMDFGALFPRGGRLMSLSSMSTDSSQGVSSLLVAVSENGDMVIFEGTDPSNASTWYVKGTWKLGAPATEKCLYQFGGDVLYMSVDGLMPLSTYMQTTTTQVALSDTIQKTLSQLSVAQGALSGWQLHDVLSKNLLVLNVPQINPMNNLQFIYNTITKGWALFTGWPAQCWATLNGATFFGGFQQVCSAFTGYKDGAGADGQGGLTYTASAQQAFTYGSDTARARQKHVTMARLNIRSESTSPNMFLAVNADFSTAVPTAVGSAVPVLTSLWDVDKWDQGTWGGQINSYNAWQTVTAYGYCFSVIVSISVQAATVWDSTDFVFTVGGTV